MTRAIIHDRIPGSNARIFCHLPSTPPTPASMRCGK
jgi:hypothetical protein